MACIQVASGSRRGKIPRLWLRGFAVRTRVVLRSPLDARVHRHRLTLAREKIEMTFTAGTDIVERLKGAAEQEEGIDPAEAQALFIEAAEAIEHLRDLLPSFEESLSSTRSPEVTLRLGFRFTADLFLDGCLLIQRAADILARDPIAAGVSSPLLIGQTSKFRSTHPTSGPWRR